MYSTPQNWCELIPCLGCDISQHEVELLSTFNLSVLLDMDPETRKQVLMDCGLSTDVGGELCEVLDTLPKQPRPRSRSNPVPIRFPVYDIEQPQSAPIFIHNENSALLPHSGSMYHLRNILNISGNSINRAMGLFRRISRNSRHESLSRTFFCPICRNRCPLENSTAPTGCGHLFCRDCMIEYLVSRISDGCLDVRCPFYDEDNNELCTFELEYGDIQDLLSAKPEIITKYQRFKALKDPNTRLCPYCNAPNSGLAQSPMMLCRDCRRAFCFHHSLAHGVDETCRDYEKRIRGQDSATKKYIQSTCKPCPSCSAPTYKLSGCNHMTCRCGTDWCWLCSQTIINTGALPAHYDTRNVLSPCAGLQFAEQPLESTCINRLKRIVMFPLYAILSLFAIIIYLLLVIILFPYWICIRKLRRFVLHPFPSIQRITVYLVLFLRGLIFTLAVVMLTFISAPFIIALFGLTLALWIPISIIYVPLATCCGCLDDRWFKIPCWPCYIVSTAIDDD